MSAIAPPGALFHAATLVAITVAVDAFTRRSLELLFLAGILWLAIAVVWLLRFLPAATRQRWRLSGRAWARWLLVPIAMGSVLVASLADIPYDARLGLSRGSMDAMAVDVIAGGPTDRGWVGLYDVGDVTRTQNGVRFVVDSAVLGRWGFAYSSEGEPVFIDDEEEAAGLWTGAWFEPIGGGWWKWTQGWD